MKNIEIQWMKEGIIKKLMDDQVSYYLEDMNKNLSPTERLDLLLDVIDGLCESRNQLSHLDSLGVDNWICYEEIDIYEDEEEDDEDEEEDDDSGGYVNV